MAGSDNIGNPHLAFDETLENIVENRIGRQRILVLLIFAQFGGRRLGDDVRRNDDAIRSERAFGFPAIAQFRQAKHLRLVKILDRIETAVHVAVERRIADRHFGFVAGRHHHRAEFVRQRHEQSSAHPALQVLFRDVAWKPAENRREHGLEALDRRVDRQDVIANAERLRAKGRIFERRARREAIGHHDAADAGRPQRIDAQRRGESRIDAARKTHDDAGETVLLDIFPEAQHAGRIIGFVALFDHGPRRLDANP